MYRIFIVEDDAVIAGQIAEYLEKWGYEVETVRDFADVMSQFAAFEPQLVLMDIGLPFYNGYYWCGEIRKVSQTPIIFISSASDNMNVVMAVNMGGDDFVVKPFDLTGKDTGSFKADVCLHGAGNGAGIPGRPVKYDRYVSFLPEKNG